MFSYFFKSLSTKGTVDPASNSTMAFRELSVFWRIENFSLLGKYPSVQSAPFSLRVAPESRSAQKFRIQFDLNSSTKPDGTFALRPEYFHLNRAREKRAPPLRVSFSALLATGEYLKFHDGGRVRNGIEVEECEEQFEDYNFLTENRSSHLPGDTLTFLVQFSSREPAFGVERLFARTAVPHDKVSFEWEIDDLSVNHEKSIPNLHVDLKLETAPNSNRDAYEIVVRPRDITRLIIPTVCDILLRKDSGERIAIKEFASIRAESKCFAMSKNFCERHAQEALNKSGSLALCFEFRYTNFGPVPLDIGETPFAGFVENLPEALRNVPDTNGAEKPNDPSVDLNSDLRNLYSHHTFSDFTLRAGGRSFPVHKNILAARSAVFCAMFEADMRERRENRAEVPDVDAVTTDRMLRFLYSTEFQDLDVEGASKLFAAADKYQIESLKSRCVKALLDGLTAENVCQVLSLADKYSERTLMTRAKKFVFWNSDLVCRTKEWKRYAAENPQVASDIMSLPNQQE